MAKNNEYDVTSLPDLSVFQFTSRSKDKVINKRIQYSKLEESFENKAIYNLAFGDVDDDNNLDDLAESNNGDIIKVISIVLSTISDYVNLYPDRCIYFTGSNEQRTKFYQTVIRRKISGFAPRFMVYGIKFVNDYESVFEEFNPEKEYDAFIVSKR